MQTIKKAADDLGEKKALIQFGIGLFPLPISG